MRIAKIALTIIGVLAFLMGLVWMGQGTGYFPYPEGNFMVNDSPWILRGAILSLVGIGLFWYSRRL